MKDYKITLGIAPTRRDGFPDPKDAVRNKAKIMPAVHKILKKAGKVDVVDIDWLNDEGLLVGILRKKEWMPSSCPMPIMVRKRR